jgi:murein endopeptidase
MADSMAPVKKISRQDRDKVERKSKSRYFVPPQLILLIQKFQKSHIKIFQLKKLFNLTLI